MLSQSITDDIYLVSTLWHNKKFSQTCFEFAKCPSMAIFKKAIGRDVKAVAVDERFFIFTALPNWEWFTAFIVADTSLHHVFLPGYEMRSLESELFVERCIRCGEYVHLVRKILGWVLGNMSAAKVTSPHSLCKRNYLHLKTQRLGLLHPVKMHNVFLNQNRVWSVGLYSRTNSNPLGCPRVTTVICHRTERRFLRIDFILCGFSPC